MSEYWLYDQVLIERPEWQPTFALSSSLNWIKALSYEINQEHGALIERQFNSCMNLCAQIRNRGGNIPLAPIYGTLYHAITFSISLNELYHSNTYGPVMLPSAVISWYYSIYNSFKSILAAFDNRQTETHTAMIRALNGGNGFGRYLPHPFNMVATRTTGEQYHPTFPKYPNVPNVDLSITFNNTRSTAQGMILSYLNGTAKWEVDKIKQRLIDDRQVVNFRTRNARTIRDNRLPSEVNFLNCAFRYRGKANYRDSMFLAYGLSDQRLNNGYIGELFNISRFTILWAIAYISKRTSRANVIAFINDVQRHLRGLNTLSEGSNFINGINV